MTLQKLKEIYKVTMAGINGLMEAGRIFKMHANEIKLYIQCNERLYKRSKFTISEALQIWYLREIGYTHNEIIEIHKSSKSTIIRVLKEMDIQNDREIHRNLGQAQIASIILHRQQGLSYKAIAEMYNTDINNIKQVLKPFQCNLPSHVGGRKAQISDEEIMKMRQLRKLGYSYTKIAKEFKRSLSTVYNYTNFKKDEVRVYV